MDILVLRGQFLWPIKRLICVKKKVGCNDPYPCGSGKKYKQCHGRLVDATE